VEENGALLNETPLAQKMLWENIELLKNYDLY
jgi:hypothetical protein